MTDVEQTLFSDLCVAGSRVHRIADLVERGMLCQPEWHDAVKRAKDKIDEISFLRGHRLHHYGDDDRYSPA